MSHRVSSDLESVSSTSLSSRGSPAHSQRHGHTPESDDLEEQKHSRTPYSGHSAMYLNSSGSYDYSPTTSGQPSEANSHRMVKPDSFVPAEVAKSQIRKMEKEMQKMQQKHYQLIKEMDQNYANIEREMHDRYAEFITKWKNQVRTRVSQYKSALDAALTEKNALREDAETTIASLQEQVTKLAREQNALLSKYNQDLSQRDSAKEKIISELQTTYERQIDSLAGERAALLNKVEELQEGTKEWEMRNEELAQRVEEYEMAAAELTKKYEGEADLVKATLSTCEQDLLDLMVSNMVFVVNERNNLRERYLKEKTTFEHLRQMYNVEGVKIKTFVAEFEQKFGRKCEPSDREAIKSSYVRLQRFKTDLEASKRQLLELRNAALKEGVRVEEIKSVATPRRVRSISPRLALNLSLDSYTSTPTNQELDRSRADMSYVESSDHEVEPRERPRLEIARVKGRLTPRSVSQAQSVVADSIISSTTTGEVKKLRGEVEILKKELSGLRMKTLEEAPDYPTVYHQEILALRSELEVCKQRSLQERRKLTFKEVEELRSENARLKEQISTLQVQPPQSPAFSKKEELQRQIDLYSSENRSLLSQMEQLRNDMESLSAQCESLSQSNEAWQARADALEAENKDLLSEVMDLRPVRDRVKTAETDATKQIRELESRSAAAINQAREENSSLRAKVDQFEQERVELEAQLESANDQVTSLKAALSPLSQQVSALTENHIELKRALSSKEQELKASLLQRRDLYNQLADLRGNIRVVCRVRPLNRMELQHSAAGSIINIQDEFSLTCETKPGSISPFTYDAVFSETATQEEVFEDTKRLIQSAIDGFNVCIFAYGQTGSGKTYTILGDEVHPGITPRAITELFATLCQLPKPFTYKVSCYMVELYLDHIIDLLLPKKVKQPSLTIRKDSTGRVFIPEATVLKAMTAKALQEIFEQGSQNRHTSDTRMNDSSSRSHLIFSILLEVNNPDTDLNRMGKLSLVDLAGSERVKKTGATAERLKEGQAISLSLTALGTVITALAEQNPHVPYRDNKLTMLMSDSLGGDVSVYSVQNSDVREHFPISLQPCRKHNVALLRCSCPKHQK